MTTSVTYTRHKDVNSVFVGTNGTIFNTTSGRISGEHNIKPNNWGYLKVKCGTGNPRPLHRVVAETYLRPVEGKPFVNHINGNKTDNRIENLEYVTQSENLRHAKLHERCHACGLRLRRGRK